VVSWDGSTAGRSQARWPNSEKVTVWGTKLWSIQHMRNLQLVLQHLRHHVCFSTSATTDGALTNQSRRQGGCESGWQQHTRMMTVFQH
jgi:hypothetical protein